MYVLCLSLSLILFALSSSLSLSSLLLDLSSALSLSLVSSFVSSFIFSLSLSLLVCSFSCWDCNRLEGGPFPVPRIPSCPIPLLCERSRAPVSGMGTSRGEVKRALAPCAAGASGPRHPVYRAAAHTVLVAWASLRAVRWVISSLSTLCVCLLFIRYLIESLSDLLRPVPASNSDI